MEWGVVLLYRVAADKALPSLSFSPPPSEKLPHLLHRPGECLKLEKGRFCDPHPQERAAGVVFLCSFLFYRLFCSQYPCINLYSVSQSTKMKIAQMLDDPEKDTSTRAETQPRDIITSTSGSPIPTPHTRSDAAKASTTKRRQTKAACLGCRQRKSKVGILLFISSLPPFFHPDTPTSIHSP